MVAFGVAAPAASAAPNAPQGTAVSPTASAASKVASAGKVCNPQTTWPEAGRGGGTHFPGDQAAEPDLSMIPSGATKIACLDYDRPVSEQWGAYSGKCPPVTDFNLDHTTLRIPSTDPNANSMHYMVSGICNKEDPIIGTGGVSRRAEISSHVQPTDAVEGDERWYYLSIRPEQNMPTPMGNYFLVTQWHPKTNRSPTLSINFHSPDGPYDPQAPSTVDIGEDHKWRIGQLHKGKWTDYVLHVKFSAYPIGTKKGTGWVEAWENGVKTVCKASAGLAPQQPSEPPRCPQAAGVDPAPFAALPDKSVFIKQGIYANPPDPSEGGAKYDVWHDGMTVWMP